MSGTTGVFTARKSTIQPKNTVILPIILWQVCINKIWANDSNIPCMIRLEKKKTSFSVFKVCDTPLNGVNS